MSTDDGRHQEPSESSGPKNAREIRNEYERVIETGADPSKINQTMKSLRQAIFRTQDSPEKKRREGQAKANEARDRIAPPPQPPKGQHVIMEVDTRMGDVKKDPAKPLTQEQLRNQTGQFSNARYQEIANELAKHEKARDEILGQKLPVPLSKEDPVSKTPDTPEQKKEKIEKTLDAIERLHGDIAGFQLRTTDPRQMPGHHKGHPLDRNDPPSRGRGGRDSGPERGPDGREPGK